MPIGDMPIIEVLLRELTPSISGSRILTWSSLELLESLLPGWQPMGAEIFVLLLTKKNLSYSFGPLSLVGGLDDTFLVANGDVLTTLPLCDLVNFP